MSWEAFGPLALGAVILAAVAAAWSWINERTDGGMARAFETAGETGCVLFFAGVPLLIASWVIGSYALRLWRGHW